MNRANRTPRQASWASRANPPAARTATRGVCMLALLACGAAQAAAKLNLDEERWLSLGAGLRTSFNALEDAAPGSSDYSHDFELDSFRLFIKGQVHRNIGFTVNTERDTSGNSEKIRAIDVIARFEFSPAFKLWAGRLLTPADRLNLDGPYHRLSWNLPRVQRYPAIFSARDDGVAVWGQIPLGSTQFKYQAGAFEGCTDSNNCNTGADPDDNLFYAGRVTLNFWDPEPGYTNRSTYFGAKDILALGVVVQSQKDAVGSATDQADYLGWNVDALMEKSLPGGGVVTLEAAYYNFDLDNASATGALIEGSSYFVQGAYLFPRPLGPGKLQPYLQLSTLDPDRQQASDKWEAGLNYVIDAHNARISAVVGNTETGSGSERNFFTLGVQLKI